MTRPNVLLIYTDQQRWDALGAVGNPFVKTPNLDRLAAQGTLFDHCFANTPVCMPSRMSMLSGQYGSALGITFNGVEMPQDMPCIQNFLNPYGYNTANIGKLHFKNHASPFRDHRDPYPTYGFKKAIISDEPGCYDDPYLKWVEERDSSAVADCQVDTPPAWTGKAIQVHPRDTHQPYAFQGPDHLTHSAFVADETISFLEKQGSAPFFCIAGFYAPHCPLNPPQRFVDLYDPSALPLPQRNPGENFQDVDDAQWRKVKAYYYALMTHVDEEVGRILDALDASGKANETLVLFTSDHGENLGDHGLIQKSQSYDSSARVPLILRYPDKIAPQGIRPEIVEAVDLVPSILDWCGIQAPPFLHGQSLRPLLENRPYAPREEALIEYGDPRGRHYQAIRSKQFLYQLDSDEKELLFDMERDPNQLSDVAADPQYAEALSHCRKRLAQRALQAIRRDRQRTGRY